MLCLTTIFPCVSLSIDSEDTREESLQGLGPHSPCDSTNNLKELGKRSIKFMAIGREKTSGALSHLEMILTGKHKKPPPNPFLSKWLKCELQSLLASPVSIWHVQHLIITRSLMLRKLPILDPSQNSFIPVLLQIFRQIWKIIRLNNLPGTMEKRAHVKTCFCTFICSR